MAKVTGFDRWTNFFLKSCAQGRTFSSLKLSFSLLEKNE